MAKKLLIIGRDSLNNSLLASHIEKQTSYPCHVVDFNRHFLLKSDVLHTADLLLLDCNNCNDNKIETALDQFSKIVNENINIALFNVADEIKTTLLAQNPFVKGIFSDHVPHEKFICGINSMLKGELWLSRKLMSEMLNNKRKKSGTVIQDFGLTRRETEIIKLIARGARNHDIANELCLSAHTVKTHIYHIYKKLKLDNRMQAAGWANQHLIPPQQVRTK